MPETIFYDLEELNVPHEYYSISVPKQRIVQAITETLAEQKMSIRKLAEQAEMKHPQIIRITQGKNYEIETLLRILDVLDMEIQIKKKS